MVRRCVANPRVRFFKGFAGNLAHTRRKQGRSSFLTNVSFVGSTGFEPRQHACLGVADCFTDRGTLRVICARRPDDTDARREARRCFGRSHPSAVTTRFSSRAGGRDDIPRKAVVPALLVATSESAWFYGKASSSSPRPGEARKAAPGGGSGTRIPLRPSGPRTRMPFLGGGFSLSQQAPAYTIPAGSVVRNMARYHAAYPLSRPRHCSPGFG
jgi:hypothetical protein